LRAAVRPTAALSCIVHRDFWQQAPSASVLTSDRLRSALATLPVTD
jgi:hypothetical protein